MEADVASRGYSPRRSPRARSRASRSTASGSPAPETHATLPLALGCPRPLPRRQPHNDRDSNRTATATARSPGQPGIATATTQRREAATDRQPPHGNALRTAPHSARHSTTTATPRQSARFPQPLRYRSATATATAAATTTATTTTTAPQKPQRAFLTRGS
jgi:hypothetical protein